MPVAIAPIIQAGAGVAQIITNAVNNKKAKQEAEELARTRPKYAINPLVQQELDFAEGNIGGLSPEAESAYGNLNNQQFASSLGAILRGGGSVNNVGSLFGANEEGRQRLALLNDQMRLNQINNLSRARANMVEQQDKAFEFNEWRSWADRAQATAASRQQAQNNIWNGIGTAASAGMQFAGQMQNQNRYDRSLQLNQPVTSAGRPVTATTTYEADYNPNGVSDFVTGFEAETIPVQNQWADAMKNYQYGRGINAPM